MGIKKPPRKNIKAKLQAAAREWPRESMLSDYISDEMMKEVADKILEEKEISDSEYTESSDVELILDNTEATSRTNRKFCKKFVDGAEKCAFGCTFAHSADQINPYECKYGADCKCRKRCDHIHPDETPEEMLARLREFSKNKYTKMCTTPECRGRGCDFAHRIKSLRPRECTNAKCNNPRCRYLHKDKETVVGLAARLRLKGRYYSFGRAGKKVLVKYNYEDQASFASEIVAGLLQSNYYDFEFKRVEKL